MTELDSVLSTLLTVRIRPQGKGIPFAEQLVEVA